MVALGILVKRKSTTTAMAMIRITNEYVDRNSAALCAMNSLIKPK